MDFHGQQLSLFPAEAPSSGQQVVVEVTESVKFVHARGAHNFKPDEEWGWEELRDYVVERMTALWGPFPRQLAKEKSIFSSFVTRKIGVHIRNIHKRTNA